MSSLAATSVVPLYAGFWRRGAASLLDGLVLLLPGVAVSLVVPQGLAQFLAQLAVGALYYSLMHSSQSQATLGKKAFGIKVTGLDGERIGFGRALGRVAGSWLSTILLCIGFVLAGFTARKQALHDMIAGTLVVNRHAEPDAVVAGGDTMPITGGVWAMVVVLLLVPFFGGMLAAIAIPAYQDYTVRAKVAQVIAASAPLKGQVAEAYAQKRPWATGPVKIDTPYASSAEITPQGHVVVTIADGVARNGRVRFTPVDASGSVQWKCSAEDLPPKYLPAYCRQ
jgi:uncharacterized RDD family membrane protein YckC/Tfp pilus assembly major pilin PilA